MIDRARKVAEIFKEYGVAYLFIGKFGAILYGYPGTAQDIDIFPLKEKSDYQKLVNALKELGFHLDTTLKEAILKGKEFIYLCELCTL
jgi:predicted nucleotidyltransferase